MNELLWMFAGLGFMTGGVASYLACILFARRLLKEEAVMLLYLVERQKRRTEKTYTFNIIAQQGGLVNEQTHKVH